MSNEARETQCTHCIHREVCLHKQDFLDICSAVYAAKVHKETTDGKHSMRNIFDYDCLSRIDVFCRHYERRMPNTKAAEVSLRIGGKYQ